MRKMTLKFLTAMSVMASMWLMAGTTTAAELSGVTFDETVEVGGKKLSLNGMGVRQGTRFRVKGYIAGLYLEEKTANSRSILRSRGVKYLELKFVRNVNKHTVIEAWDEGFEKNAGDSMPKIKDDIKKLKGWMSGVGSGESFSFAYIPGQGLEVKVKGKTKGVIPGEDFARVFFAIWIGDHPVSAKLKSGLLGRSAK